MAATVFLIASAATADWSYNLRMLDGALPIYIETNGAITGANGPAYNLQSVRVIAGSTTNWAMPAVIVGANATIVSNVHDPAYTTLHLGPLTNTYATAAPAWPAAAALGIATNGAGTLADDATTAAWRAVVYAVTNIGGAWHATNALTASTVVVGDGTGEFYDVIATWTNAPGCAYWLMLTNAAADAAALWTNVPAAAHTFAGTADYDSAPDLSRHFYTTTNAVAPVFYLAGGMDAGGNWITNLAAPTVPSAAATKYYCDTATNNLETAWYTALTNKLATDGF